MAITGATTAAALLLAACATPSAPPGAQTEGTRPSVSATTSVDGHGTSGTPGSGHGSGPSQATPTSAPLRHGERFVTLRMPSAYTPKAPGPGTDDYRCFLLDPKLAQKALVTGVNVLPGNADVVHHVILFRLSPAQVAVAEQQDRESAGQGWTCFGGSGVENQDSSPDAAPWLGAWAPGGGEQVLAPDLGIPLPQGSRIVMQVHYNLLAGRAPDTTAAKLRLADDNGSRNILQTVLLPGPVELPCRPGKTGALCSRAAAVADVQARFGERAGLTADYLNVACKGVGPSSTQSCTRPITEAATIRAAAGHMHLLGRSITLTINRGGADERTVLDIPVWDFDDQGSRPVSPGVKVGKGDTLTVTCTHDQSLRDMLPAFAGQPERYVVWGDGTTDEMCLGIVMVTRP